VQHTNSVYRGLISCVDILRGFTKNPEQRVSPSAIPVCVPGGGALRYSDLRGVGSSGSAALVLASASDSISAGVGFRVGPLKVFRFRVHVSEILHSCTAV
jgi:hypothetical protein